MDAANRAVLQRCFVGLADGDREAFHPAFELLWPRIRRFVVRHVRRSDADDVAQDALLKVFSRAAQFDASRDALAWALAIAAWEIKTARRREYRRREQPHPEDATISDVRPTPEQLVVADDLEDELRQALACLPARDAATLAVFVSGGRPEIKPATYRKRVERALVRLRMAWSVKHGSR